MLDQRLMNQIHHDEAVITSAIVKAVANEIIPALRKLIEQEAAKVANQFEPDSPFAADAAMRLMLTEAAEFLFGEECDTPDQIPQIHQLTPRHVLYMQMPSWAEDKTN